MRQQMIKISLLIAAIAALAIGCGSGKATDESPEDFPTSVEKPQADAAIADAQTAYNALGEDGSAETGKAKDFLDKAKEYRNDGEAEAAWAAATKAKSFCNLSKILRETRAAGLK